MNGETFGPLLGFAFAVGLMVLGYVAGTVAEKRHYASIRRRETALVRLPALTFETTPESWSVTRGTLVTGCVVVSLDYFKRFLAGLRMIVGGRLRSYETLLDRARREAVLRLKEEARRNGCQAVINVRLTTSRIASSQRDGKGVAGLEVLAFGTAVSVSELKAQAPAL